MAYRNLKEIMPTIDDFIMQVLGISSTLYGMRCIVGWSAYDLYRPSEWPTAKSFLRFYGYAPNAAGWKEFVSMHIGQRVVEMNDHRSRLRRKEKWCKNCGNLEVHRMGRCGACYVYWLRNDKDRPRYLWDSESVCKNCTVPLASTGTKPRKGGWKRRRQCKGRCDTCDVYWRKYHVERPRRLWGIGEHGWCTCGYPAVALVEDIPVCSRHRE